MYMGSIKIIHAKYINFFFNATVHLERKEGMNGDERRRINKRERHRKEERGEE